MNQIDLLKAFAKDIQSDLKNIEEMMERLEFSETFSKHAPDILWSHVIAEITIAKASMQAKVQEALRGNRKDH